MRNKLAIIALAFATTLAMGQTSKDKDNDVYKVNQSGTQKITNGPVIEYTSDHSAMIAWSTKFPGGTYLAYGTDPNNLSQRTEKAWGGTNHRLEIKNLQPSTTYYFQVRSEDAKGHGAGADVQSNVEQFKTVAKGAAPDKTNYNVGVNGNNATNAGTTSGMPSPSGSGQYEPLYRMLGSGNHFFTTDPTEHAEALARGDFHDEGIAGYLATGQISGTQPFYRMAKQVGNVSDHLFTANPSERQAALAQGYRDEGISGYIASSQIPGTVPLYRLRGGNGTHFYTTDNSERQNVIQRGGFQDEGIAGYVWQNQQ